LVGVAATSAAQRATEAQRLVKNAEILLTAAERLLRDSDEELNSALRAAERRVAAFRSGDDSEGADM
jgi:hypothetical protein